MIKMAKNAHRASYVKGAKPREKPFMLEALSIPLYVHISILIIQSQIHFVFVLSNINILFQDLPC
jgi:hypothetical protein